MNCLHVVSVSVSLAGTDLPTLQEPAHSAPKEELNCETGMENSQNQTRKMTRLNHKLNPNKCAQTGQQVERELAVCVILKRSFQSNMSKLKKDLRVNRQYKKSTAKHYPF